MTDRQDELETKLAFQEDAIRQLSDLVYEHSRRIDALESLCRRLAERLADADSGGASPDPAGERPPHY